MNSKEKKEEFELTIRIATLGSICLMTHSFVAGLSFTMLYAGLCLIFGSGLNLFNLVIMNKKLDIFSQLGLYFMFGGFILFGLTPLIYIIKLFAF